MAKTKVCTVCGSKYEYCSHCDSNNIKNMWRSLYCSENCRDIYDVCGKYVAGKLTKVEAYNILKDLDTSKDIRLNGVKKNVTEIMGTAKTIPTVETPVENEPVVIEEPTMVEETPVVEEYVKPRRSRRRFVSTED